MSRLDRRALFTSGAAAALLSAAGMSAQASPRRGGTLRLALARRDGVCPVLTGALYETLTEIGADGVLRPMLAASWSSADALVWDLTLDPAARFSDGAAVDAVAVHAALSGYFPNLQVLEAARLRLTLDAPDPNLPWRLASSDLSVVRADGVGTGFYRLRDRRAGGHFIAERVPHHARDGQAGWADRIEVVTISDPQVRAEALRDGHVDIAELPARDGLRGSFRYHPTESDAVLVAQSGVGLPAKVAGHAPLDGGRIAERWWLV